MVKKTIATTADLRDIVDVPSSAGRLKPSVDRSSRRSWTWERSVILSTIKRQAPPRLRYLAEERSGQPHNGAHLTVARSGTVSSPLLVFSPKGLGPTGPRLLPAARHRKRVGFDRLGDDRARADISAL